MNKDTNKELPFQIPAEIVSVSTLKNKQLRIHLESQENLTEEAMARLMNLSDKLGWFTFNVSMIQADEIADLPEIKNTDMDKSPSQRLRSRMYVYFINNKDTSRKGFEQWYSDALEEIGRKYLDKVS